MNKSFFYGNVATTPELKGNNNVLSFRVAVNTRVFNSETDAWEDSADFFPFVLFGKRAEAVSKFLTKGMPVTLEAHARQNNWTTEDGQNRSAIEFVVDDIQVGRKAEAAA